jgi:hypothetical protein
VEHRKITLADAARALIRRMDAGVLSTHSVEAQGYPFGSLIPFVATQEGRPVILISAMAQHTRNILADSRVCLTVYDPGEKDKLASSRVSIMGNGGAVAESDRGLIADRYFSFFPSSREFESSLDFHFYWIEPYRVRFVSGFGRIHWLPREGWLVPSPEWKTAEQEIIKSVNDSHRSALLRMCRYFHQRKTSCAQLIAADPEGFHVRTDSDILYFVFERPCFLEDELMAEIALMAEQSEG